MAVPNRVLAVALLALGVGMVFLGLTASLGFTLVGVLSSVAAIAALLYTGGIWFGGAGAPAMRPDNCGPILFDRHSLIVSGPGAGQPLVSRFPAALRPEIERQCATVLAGLTARFPCGPGSAASAVDAVPVRRADGTVIYGLLIPAEAESKAAQGV